jgi:hypothetical protein
VVMAVRSLRSVAWAVGLLTLVLAAPLAASAGVVNYYFTPGSTGCTGATTLASCSNQTNIGALDEHYVYTWRISDPALKGQNITSLTLTFKDLYNWDTGINGLFVHLLQNSNMPGTNNPGFTDNTGTVQGVGPCGATNCVSQYQDVSTDLSDFTPFDDLVNPSSNSDDSSWLIPSTVVSSTSDKLLTTTSFGAQGQNDISTGAGDPAPVGSLPAGWTATSDGPVACPTGPQCSNLLYTYTFTFNNASTLNSFISDDGLFAIGLDADCHYFNNGIVLSLQTSGLSTQGSTPEPVSLVLLGTGMLFMARRVSRRRQ